MTDLLKSRADGVVQAAIVTHEHPNHCANRHALSRMHYGQTGCPRIPPYCPLGGLDRLSGLERDVDLHSM